MKRIICRADGNANTGLGHLYRLFALYEIYKNDYNILFVTRYDSVLTAIPENYNVKLVPSEISIDQEPEWLNQTFSSKTDIIIADGYQFNSNYQYKLKKHGFFLVYVDDLAQEKMYADIIINHSPSVTINDFNTESYSKLALGTDYAILRPGFLYKAQQERVINKIDKVFVCFGGADKLNLSLAAVKALLSFSTFKEIHVVLGGAYTHKEIVSLSYEVSERLFLHKNLNESELIEVMECCNFAIAPSSTICYELSCIKMPILSGFFVDNQELIYKGFLSENVIFEGGDFKNFTEEDFKSLIEDVLRLESYELYIMNQSRLFDGQIKSRFLELL